jgi:hypothetical protein
MVLKVSLTTTFDEYPAAVLVGGKKPPRQETGFRIFINNIKDITANYNFTNGLNMSDIIYRMYFKEYANLTTENDLVSILSTISSGWYRGVKLFPTLKGEFKVSTRIGTLRSNGDADAVRPIILTHMRV